MKKEYTMNHGHVAFRRMVQVAVVATAFAFGADDARSAKADPIEQALLGVRIGMRLEDVTADLRGRCKPEEGGGTICVATRPVRTWVGWTKGGHVKATHGVVRFVDVEYEPSGKFAALVAAMIAKFGQPARDKTTTFSPKSSTRIIVWHSESLGYDLVRNRGESPFLEGVSIDGFSLMVGRAE